jgi:hypothetical protein
MITDVSAAIRGGAIVRDDVEGEGAVQIWSIGAHNTPLPKQTPSSGVKPARSHDGTDARPLRQQEMLYTYTVITHSPKPTNPSPCPDADQTSAVRTPYVRTVWQTSALPDGRFVRTVYQTSPLVFGGPELAGPLACEKGTPRTGFEDRMMFVV